MPISEAVGDTLALCNLVRSAFGAPELNDLPDAHPGDSQDCLFYRALKDVGCMGVGTHSLNFASERQAATVAALWGVSRSDPRTVMAPKAVSHVITAFDNGQTGHFNV